MKKIGLLTLVIIIALSSIGIAYARWSDSITVNGSVQSGEVKFCFDPGKPITMTDAGPDYWAVPGTDPMTCPAHVQYIGPDPEGKNVGVTTAKVIGCDTLELTTTNGYPGYYNHVDFWGKNMGTIPVRIWKVIIRSGTTEYVLTAVGTRCFDLNGDGKIDLVIEWGNGWGEQLEPDDSHNFSFDYSILQPAPQNAEGLTWSAELFVTQWNEYP